MAAHSGVLDNGLDDRVARVEGLLAELAALPDAAARSQAEEVIGTVLELHGVGLQRMLGLIEKSPEGERLGKQFEADNVVRSLLLLHGLHPESLVDRVETALESVRPFMRSHSGGVQLLGIDEGVVHLRLEGSCNGCGASTQTMRDAVEKAIYTAAPDIVAIDVEGLAPPPVGPKVIDCLKPLPMAAPAVRANGGSTAGNGNGNGNGNGFHGDVHPSIGARPVIGG